MARRKKDNIRTAEKIALFFESLITHGGNISRACKAAKMLRSEVYSLEKSDAQFAAAFREAQQRGIDVLEDEARRRAYAGTFKPVFHKGRKVGLVREYSDTLMIFLLKGARPEKYRDNVNMSVSGGLDVSILEKARERAKQSI